MINLKDKRVARAYEEAHENIDLDFEGFLGTRIYKCSLTPIEQVMAIFLLTLEYEKSYRIIVEFQKQIKEYRVDFFITFHKEQFVIECDGHDFHERTKEQAQKDKSRDRLLQLQGYKVLRFTGSEIWKDSEWQHTIIEELENIRYREYQKYLGRKNGLD